MPLMKPQPNVVSNSFSQSNLRVDIGMPKWIYSAHAVLGTRAY